MTEHEVTNANDVELVISAAGVEGNSDSSNIGRFIVDDFSLTREEDSELVSGCGVSFPEAISSGNITFGFSFTMMGTDLAVLNRISTASGRSRLISLRARKFALDENGEEEALEWEYSLGAAKVTSEGHEDSSGDTHEVPVEGIGFRYNRRGTGFDAL